MTLRDTFRNEKKLAAWSKTFAAVVGPSPERYGLTPEQSARFAEAAADYGRLRDRCRVPDGGSRLETGLKRLARDRLLGVAREVSAACQALPTMDDGTRIRLGLTVPRRASLPSRSGPRTAPVLEVMRVDGRWASIRLTARTDDHDRSTRRGRPAGVAGAIVFSCAGPTYSADRRAWAFEAMVGRREETLRLSPDLPPGASVWLSASWYDTTNRLGPPSPPARLHVGGPSMMAA